MNCINIILQTYEAFWGLKLVYEGFITIGLDYAFFYLSFRTVVKCFLLQFTVLLYFYFFFSSFSTIFVPRAAIYFYA